MGTPGVKPLLVGSGSLVPGTSITLQLFDAKAEASGTLFLGPAKGGEPYHCGVLVPLPEIVHVFTTTAEGVHQVQLPLPLLDPVSPLFIQAWIEENGHEVVGPPRCVYFHNPEFTVQEDMVAEVQIPIMKKE